MAIRKKSVNTWVKNLKKSDDYYFYQLGSKPEKAARILQKFVKQLLFKFKIRRILRTYTILQQQKINEIQLKLQKFLRVLKCKETISNLKFEIKKKFMLSKIRERVAITSVKGYWKKSKFTFKIIMQKIKKFKRMIRNEKRFSTVDKDTSNISKKGFYKGDHLNAKPLLTTRSKNSILSEDFDTNENEGENEEENKKEEESLTSDLNRRQEQERQEKIARVRLSYNLPKAKEPLNVLPYLYQKDILEGMSPPSHYISTTRATVFRMNVSNPKRVYESNAKTSPQNLLSLIKPYTSSAPRPKLGGDQPPAYMKPTTASKMCRWDAEAPNEEIEEPKKNIKPRDDSKVLSPTFAYMQKVTKTYTKKDTPDKPIWRPSTQYHDPNTLPDASIPSKIPKTAKSPNRPLTLASFPIAQQKKFHRSISPSLQNKFEINSLNFEAALPELSDIVNSYNNRFIVRVRPKIEKNK